MSKYEKAFVRSMKSIEMKNDPLLEELFFTDDYVLDVPLVYQYAQKSVNPNKVQIAPEDIIGKVVAMYTDPEDQCIYADVIINDMMAKAVHFTGVLDNFTLKIVNKGRHGNEYDFVQFIVYDKDFKRKVDDKCLMMKETQEEAKTTVEQVRQNHYSKK